jgi:Protein of unknown function (DUF2591)
VEAPAGSLFNGVVAGQREGSEMKIKVSEATPTQIDWLVVVAMLSGRYSVSDLAPYSTSWEHGGPILEENKISVTYMREGGYTDLFRGDFKHGGPKWWDDTTTQYGATYLLAGMRCYVASIFGEEVEILEGLK